MSFDINNNVPKNLFKENLTNDESLAARKAALDLAKHIEQRAEGSRFPGRLRVHNLKAALKGGENPIQVKRANWFKNIFTSTNHVQKSSVYLRSLMGAAYKDKISPEAYEKIMAKVDKHLNKNLGFDGFGSRHFAKFVREFENASHIRQDAGNSNFLDAESNMLLPASVHGVVNSQNKSIDNKALENIKKVLPDNSQVSDVNQLSQSNDGVIYQLKSNQKNTIIKINTSNILYISDNLRSGDTAAVKSKVGMARVLEPEMFIIKVLKEGSPPEVVQVAKKDLTHFIKDNEKTSQASGVSSELILLGTVMKSVSGQPLSHAIKNGSLNDKDFGRLATGLFASISETRANRIVHHDIKPANVLFDSESGNSYLIDLGGAVRLHKNDMQTSSVIGSPPYSAPAVLQGKPHGLEVDRFSYAVTLLSAMEPNITSNETIDRLSSFLGGKANFLGANGEPQTLDPQAYLSEYMRALNEAHPEAAERLQARFDGNPALKKLIEQSFIASSGGPQGDAAWRAVYMECLPNVGKDKHDIKELNYAFKNDFISDSTLFPDLFRKVADRKNFNYQLNDLVVKGLTSSIKFIINKNSQERYLDDNNMQRIVSDGRLVKTSEIAENVENKISQFIDAKINMLNKLDERKADKDLESLVKKQILIQDQLNAEQFISILDTVPKLVDVVNGFEKFNSKNAFIDFVKARHAMGVNNDSPEFYNTLLQVFTSYCKSKNIDLKSSLNGVFSDDLRSVYSLFSVYRHGESDGYVENAFVASLDDRYNSEHKEQISQSMDKDLFDFNNFINNIQLSLDLKLSSPGDGVNPATSISDQDRQLIINELYPPLN